MASPAIRKDPAPVVEKPQPPLFPTQRIIEMLESLSNQRDEIGEIVANDIIACIKAKSYSGVASRLRQLDQLYPQSGYPYDA